MDQIFVAMSGFPMYQIGSKGSIRDTKNYNYVDPCVIDNDLFYELIDVYGESCYISLSVVWDLVDMHFPDSH